VQHSGNISKNIKAKAKELGFLECAIIPAGLLEEEKKFQIWLNAGMHGEMGYMARNDEKRLDPRLLFENAKTVIVVLQNYYPKETQKDSDAPVLSKYAYGTDYHFVMKDKLKNLLAFIQEQVGSCNARPFVDSAPVLERAWARRAGLGWVGKNSNLISVQHGSFFFIGELILDIELPYDNPKQVADHCGTCTRCIDTCPTKAIVSNRVVDARKCISYQTIELKGDLDENLKGQFENRIFGCDICQDVCPWNLKSTPHEEDSFQPHPKLLELSNKTGTKWNDHFLTNFLKIRLLKELVLKG
jgi:epoxyqueuosine reductase